MTDFLILAARRFLLALSFLSRLVNGHEATREEVVASFVWYPPAGAVIGLVAAMPFALGFAEGKPLLQGLLYTTFLAWLTRAMHWDGWADLFDALGSGRSGEEFRKILKDSRLGAFGGIALALGLGGMAVCAGICLERGEWPALVWAVILGRCLVGPLAGSTRPGNWSTLGVLSCEGASAVCVAVSVFTALGTGLLCVGLWHLLIGLALAACGVFFLRRVAARVGGINGDFMGAAIIWGELAVLLTVSVF